MRRIATTAAAVLLVSAGCHKASPSLPAKGVFFPDSLYNSSLARISDKATDGYSGPGIENEYSRADAENCDGARIILRGQDGEWYLYGRPGYNLLKHFSSLGLGEEPEPRWDASAPNRFYYLHGSQLRRYDITGDTFTTIHDFRVDYTGASFITTKTEGDASLDQRYWCFMVEDSVFMDLALAADSSDVMVFQSNATDSITMVNLNTGDVTPLVAIPFDVNGDIGLHFSGNCAATPGWCLVSTCGAENPPSGQSHSWMDNLLFMVELKADPRIVRLCRTRCYTGRNPQPNYFAEAYATVNRAGTRAYYGSNWGVYTQDYTDAYEVDLPSGWNH